MYGQPHSYPGDTGYVAARGLQPGEPAPAPDGYDEGMVHRVRGIVAELFRAPTESMVAQRGEASTYDTPDEFDESWAVPAHLADQCFHRVYNSGESLATIEPHVLGGAAAMMALRNEKDIAQQLGYPTPKDAQYEYQVMLLGLTEAESLVARKAEVTMLYPQDNPDTIGKIALATMIKVKMDAENVPKHQQNCHVQHNSVGHGHMHSQHMPAYHQQQQRPEMMSRHTFH
ncbi:hypothetical protein GGF46_005197 [Coemansia sp. RSA 552]|nr:hypothetical protein GGF46_005197 [Coemansia sp. RSA 552]